MATHNISASASRFHNLSEAALADEIGRVDAISKAAEAELKLLKDEMKARGLKHAVGDAFAVTATEQIASRADLAVIKAHLGAAYSRFEFAMITTVVRVKAAHRTHSVAA